MSHPRYLFLSLALALGVAGEASVTLAQAPAANPAAIGPAIGARIPTGAALLDSAGNATTLTAVAGGKPVMVVLFRSASWCPYCQAQLKSLGPVAAAAKAKGVGFVAISYDKPADLAHFAAKASLAFPLYSDPGGKLIAALKLRDPRYKPDSFAFGVPYPTTLLLDAHGAVRGKTVRDRLQGARRECRSYRHARGRLSRFFCACRPRRRSHDRRRRGGKSG